MSRYGKNKKALIEFLIDNPLAIPREISAATGIHRKSVHTTLSRMRDFEYKGYIVLRPSLQAETYLWLRRTCPEGVSLSDHISSILVDAMHEDTQ